MGAKPPSSPGWTDRTGRDGRTWVRWVGAEEVGGGATSDAKRQEVVVLVAERLQPAFEAALAPRRGRRRVEEKIFLHRYIFSRNSY